MSLKKIRMTKDELERYNAEVAWRLSMFSDQELLGELSKRQTVTPNDAQWLFNERKRALERELAADGKSICDEQERRIQAARTSQMLNDGYNDYAHNY